jgi:hypothetical protein
MRCTTAYTKWDLNGMHDAVLCDIYVLYKLRASLKHYATETCKNNLFEVMNIPR